uniref:Uncharacterized protein n=1 Tax=Solibacter usitatus (strain Ellin6076) TaxID=234267 RepID=Q01X42_SOLUE
MKLWAAQSFWSSGVFFNAVVPGVTGQLANEPREWGHCTPSFMRRASSSFGRNVLQQSYKAGIAAALSDEVRYVPAHNRRSAARVANALSSDFVTRNADGERVPNIAHLGGTIASEYTANLRMPDRYRTASRTKRRAGFVIAYESGLRMFKEFSPELKRLNPFPKRH